MINHQKLCAGLFSDALDKLGYKNQVITGFKLNNSGLSALGRARTLKIHTLETDDENLQLGLSFLGNLRTGEILVVSGSSKFAYFGEMMTRLSLRRGINGVFIDGLTRDTKFTCLRCSLPILARGYSPVDIKGRGRVSEVDISVKIEGVEISPHDLIYFDQDGLAVVPKEIEKELIKEIEWGLKEEERIIGLINRGVTIEDILKSVKEF